MWLGIISLIAEALKLAGQFFGWWVSVDNETRKEARDAWTKVIIAEKDGNRSAVRSALNRLNAVL
jgi:hypothetical protein